MRKRTKTKMVAEMKSGNTKKEDNAEEGRSLRSRRKNYTINEIKSHTCEEGEAHLRISFWHLLMNLKNK